MQQPIQNTIAFTACVALSAGTLCCGGCIIGVKPASETILRLTRGAYGGSDGSGRITFGIKDVFWDKLHHGYGIVGESNHPRDHQAYLFLGYDHYEPHDGRGKRMVLITPLGPLAGGDKPYRVELLVPMGLVFRRRPGPEGYLSLFGAIAPPVHKAGQSIRFDLENVPMTSTGPSPRRILLSGRIVAKRTTLPAFENNLSRWHSLMRRKGQ